MSADGRTVWRPYAQMLTAPVPPTVVLTKGVRLHLADGRALIDGTSSWWTACHGYNHPHIAAAVADQLGRMPHVMFGGLTHEPAERLAARLAAMLPGDLDHVFFSESGSVAVEVALKMAVQSAVNRGLGGRTQFLRFRHGYHGDTLGAMAVSDGAVMHGRLGAYLPGHPVASLPDTPAREATLDALVGRLSGELAAIVLEPLVQGAGGMRFHRPETLATVGRIAARHGVPLILDEIMTGFGRTGSLFACEQAGLVPDIVCLSKALTGGTLPLAATVARGPIFESFLSTDPGAALMHGPTFMANPLACAAANGSLDLFDREDRLGEVARIKAGLASGLAACAALPGVAEVRVKGAIGVVELSDPPDPAQLRARFVELGCWLRPFGRVIYLMPPFVIDEADLATLCRAVVTVVGELRPSPPQGMPGSAPGP